MSVWIEALPAYGRDYKTQAEVKADWEAGKDFRDAASGRYVNKADAENYDLRVTVHFASQAKVVAVR